MTEQPATEKSPQDGSQSSGLEAQPCDEFPDGCPNQVTVEPTEKHGGGIRCGCSETPPPNWPAVLADQLSREYDYLPLIELDRSDPGRAEEHRDAAQSLVRWIQECPREERRAAYRRGYDRGVEVQRSRGQKDRERLQAEIDELRQERDPEGLRSRITDLEYVLRGWGRFVAPGLHGATADWKAQAAEYLAKLTAVQQELAVLKGVQPSNTTGRRPS